MPSAFAHFLTAGRSLKRCPDARLREVIARHRRAYNLGAQGPDIFYFHRAWPWTPAGRLAWLADLLHARRARRFYQAAVTAIRAAPPARQDVLTAYLCGYANHQALDATVHPYVIYRTGDLTRHDAASWRAARRHGRLEVMLDALLLQQEVGQKPSWLIGQRLFAVDEGDVAMIAAFYTAVVPVVHDRSLSAAQVHTAIADAQDISSLLFDDGPSLRWALVRTVAALDRSNHVHSARYRRVAGDGSAALNSAHQPWLLPWDGSTPQHASFPDLIEAAAHSAARTMATLSAAIAGSETPNNLQVDNRSFDTGLDCDESRPLRYFAPDADQQRI